MGKEITDPEVVEEELDEELSDDETPEGEEPEGGKPEGEEPEGDKGKQKNPDEKDKNREGYKIRQSQKAVKESKIDTLTKQVENLTSTVESLTQNSKDLDFRKAHPEINDDLFNLIKSSSKGSGKSYEDMLNDKVIKSALEVTTSKSRVEGATPAPSTKTSPGGTKNVWDETEEEFDNHQEEVLRRGSN